MYIFIIIYIEGFYEICRLYIFLLAANYKLKGILSMLIIDQKFFIKKKKKIIGSKGLFGIIFYFLLCFKSCVFKTENKNCFLLFSENKMCLINIYFRIVFKNETQKTYLGFKTNKKKK